MVNLIVVNRVANRNKRMMKHVLEMFIVSEMTSMSMLPAASYWALAPATRQNGVL